MSSFWNRITKNRRTDTKQVNIIDKYAQNWYNIAI